MAASHKILVIDDDPGIGDMLNLILEFNGYEVIVSDKPELTEELILKNKVDLVILDMLISGVNGTDICKRIRISKNETISGMPVLMMSALHDAARKCKEAGANDFIAKPFEMEQFIQRIEQLVKA